MYLPDTVRRWARDALNTLTDARKQCATANTNLKWTSAALGPELATTTQLALDSIERLSRCSKRMDSAIRIYAKVITRDISFLNTPSKPNLHSLDEIVSLLSKTPVPDSKAHLDDFILGQEVKVLKQNVSAHWNNGTAISLYLTKELDSLTANWAATSRHSSRTQAQFREKMTLSEGFQSSGATIESTLNSKTLLRECDALEQELAVVLELLTNHYDQCNEAVNLVSLGNSAFDLGILEQDAQDLLLVLAELSTLCEIIETNKSRAIKLLESRLPMLGSFLKLAETHLDQYRQLRIRLMRLVFLCHHGCSRHSNSRSLELCVTVESLTKHYKTYYDVYCNQYLAELYRQQFEYPRKFWAQIDNFVHRELSQEYDRECENRTLWMERYGSFLPQELELPGPQRQPRISQVITEDMDIVAIGTQKSTESELLDLILKLQVSKTNLGPINHIQGS